MIKLYKGSPPADLLAHWEEWTSVLINKRRNDLPISDADLNRYSRPSIKAALIEETKGKCAYCESKVLHVSFGDIEHIVPKSLDDQVRFRWSNLTLACGVCNRRKGTHTGIVDPYVENPEELVGFFGVFAVPFEPDGVASRTIVLLDLNRRTLREQRYERMKRIEGLICTFLRSVGSDLEAVLRSDFIENELADDAEFAAMTRSFVRHRAPALLRTDKA